MYRYIYIYTCTCCLESILTAFSVTFSTGTITILPHRTNTKQEHTGVWPSLERSLWKWEGTGLTGKQRFPEAFPEELHQSQMYI